MTRAALAACVLAASAAACSPEIASGSYYCGAQGLCPADQVCNPADGTCVLDGEQSAFACSTLEPEPDDTPAQAQAVPGVNCLDTAASVVDCIDPGDTADWLSFALPTACTGPVSLQIRVSFDAAFQPLQLALTGSDGTPIATSQPCASTGGAGNLASACLTATGSGGDGFDLEVSPTGSDCGGACNFNTYAVTIVGGAP